MPNVPDSKNVREAVSNCTIELAIKFSLIALLRRHNGADSNSSQVDWALIFPIFFIIMQNFVLFVNIGSKSRLKFDVDSALFVLGKNSNDKKWNCLYYRRKDSQS